MTASEGPYWLRAFYFYASGPFPLNSGYFKRIISPPAVVERLDEGVDSCLGYLGHAVYFRGRSLICERAN